MTRALLLLALLLAPMAAVAQSPFVFSPRRSAPPAGGVNSGTNTGDLTLAAVGSSPSANGASLSGQVLTLQPASSTLPGVVTAGTQTIAGAKTLSSVLTLSSAAPQLSASLATATFQITSATNDATTSSSVAGFDLHLSADITAADLGWMFTDSSNNVSMSLTEAGNLTILGTTHKSASTSAAQYISSASDANTSTTIPANWIGTVNGMATGDILTAIGEGIIPGTTMAWAVTNNGKVWMPGTGFYLMGGTTLATYASRFNPAADIASVTSSVAMLTLAPRTALDANDLLFDIQNASGTRWTVDNEGDSVQNGGIAATTLNLGTSTVLDFRSATATIDFGSISVTTCADVDNAAAASTIAITSAADGDTVSLGVPNAAMVTGSTFTGWVSSAGVVTIRHCCVGAATCNPGSGTFRATVTSI